MNQQSKACNKDRNSEKIKIKNPVTEFEIYSKN
jgi:hypothetical protein